MDVNGLLNAVQIQKMRVHPDMIRQFANFVADESQKLTGVRPIIKVRCIAMLNKHAGQDLIHPAVNLAAQRDSLMPAKWIMPLKDEDPVGYAAARSSTPE